jgi:hypothetical protein
MMPSREAVMTALFNAIVAAVATSPSGPFLTASRYIKFDPAQGPTPQVATPDAQPALYIIEDDETTEHPEKSPQLTRRTWRAMLLIWAKPPLGLTPGVPDGVTSGATVINNLIDAVETAFLPDDRMRGCFTLGGLVQRCFIDGHTAKVSGDMNPDGQCFAAVPVSILVP